MMPTYDHAAFLRAIIAQPDDDLPRLIYADFLDERGDPRGEFIRAQIERPRLARHDPRRAELKAREVELLRQHGDEWLGPLAAIVSRADFHRGFVDYVFVMAEAFLAHAESLFAWTPIRSLKLRGTTGYLRALVQRPELGRLTALDLCFDHLEAREAALLAGSPLLSGLRRLNVNGNYIGDDGVTSLVHSPFLRNLEALHLESCHLSVAASGSLAASKLTRLRTLELSENALGDGGVALLVNAPFLHQFTALDLTYTGLGDEGAIRLAATPALTGLTRLRLGYNRIGDAGAAALARSPHLRNLTVLDLNGNAIHDAGAHAILAVPRLRTLTRLGLSVNPLSRAARQELEDVFGERWR